jgi:hypothetical protein
MEVCAPRPRPSRATAPQLAAAGGLEPVPMRTLVQCRPAEAFGVWECGFYEYDAVHRQVIAAPSCAERSPGMTPE